MKFDVASTFEALDRVLAQAHVDELPAVVTALSARLATASSRLLGVLPTSNGGEPKEADENLSVGQASRKLGMSEDWLYRNAGKLPFTVRIGGRVLFAARGLEKWNRQRQGRG